MKQVTAMPIRSDCPPVRSFHLVFFLLAGFVALGSGCSLQQPANETEDRPSAQQSGGAEGVYADQITPADVRVAGLRLGSPDSGESFQVAGRIQNNSPTFTLTELQLKVVLQDCLDTGVCEILAEDVADVAIEVPAGEVRDFQVDANFAEIRAPKGRLGWHYAVVDAKGTKP